MRRSIGGVHQTLTKPCPRNSHVCLRGFSLAESAVDASSNQLRSAAGNPWRSPKSGHTLSLQDRGKPGGETRGGNPGTGRNPGTDRTIPLLDNGSVRTSRLSNPFLSEEIDYRYAGYLQFWPSWNSLGTRSFPQILSPARFGFLKKCSFLSRLRRDRLRRDRRTNPHPCSWQTVKSRDDEVTKRHHGYQRIPSVLETAQETVLLWK
jgi:hypothetical protein